MGYRMRRSVRILPGVRLNFSKSGTSISFGGQGFTTNISKNGTKNTVGLPSTGLSYSSYTPRKKQPANNMVAKSNISIWIWTVLVMVGLLIYGKYLK